MTEKATEKPFCAGDRFAERAFNSWLAIIAEAGFEASELSAADVRLVGLVASREVAFERLRKEVRAEKRDRQARLSLIAAERRAAADYARQLSTVDRAFGVRAAVAEFSRPVAAVAAGGARVIPMPPRPAASGNRLARRGKAPEAVVGRILSALAAEPLTKKTLRARVSGDHGTFVQVLAELVRTGRVTRTGRGARGMPFRYALLRR